MTLAAGEILLAGEIVDQGGSTFRLSRYPMALTPSWELTGNAWVYDSLRAVTVDTDGTAYAAGESWDEGWADPSSIVIVVGSDGQPRWSITYAGEPDHCSARAIAVDPAGDVVVAGTKHDVQSGSVGAWLRKLHPL